MSELITEQYAFRNSGLEVIDQDECEEIKALLLGHKVEKIADDHMRLDDGTVVRIVPNQGGCACSAGDYYLTDLNECDNIITAVECVTEGLGDYEEYAYRVFVIAADKKLNLYSVEGDDGNGYYGTGYVLLVRRP